MVEAQTMQNNEPAIKLYKKIGFKKVDGGSSIGKMRIAKYSLRT